MLGTFCRTTALAAALYAAQAAEPAYTVRAIQVIDQAQVPEGAPQSARSIMFNKGFTIGYLVEGSDLIGFKDDSLKVTRIKLPDGKDIVHKRNGEDNYKQGSFPEVSDDGKLGYFQLECEDHVFGKAASLDIAGSIVALTGSDHQTGTTKVHGLDSKEEEKVGPFTVAFGQAKPAGMHAMFGNADRDSWGITVSGPLASITAFAVVVDGKEVKSRSWSGSGAGDGPRTYDFEKSAITGNAGAVSIRYWKDMKEQEIRFGK